MHVCGLKECVCVRAGGVCEHSCVCVFYTCALYVCAYTGHISVHESCAIGHCSIILYICDVHNV